MNQDVFKTYSIPRAIITLAVPTIATSLVVILYNLLAIFFIGQTGDSNQIASIAITGPVFLLYIALGNLFGIGGSTYIARLLGRQQLDEVKYVSSFCCYASIIVGALLSLLFITQMPTLLRLIGSSENTAPFASRYLYYLSLGGPFIVLTGTFGNILRGEGAARVALVGMIGGLFCNTLLMPVMIFTLQMGVVGAAVSSVIGNIITNLIYLYYLIYCKGTTLSVSHHHFTLRRTIWQPILSVGMPAAFTGILMSASNIIMNLILVDYGDAAIAAMGIASRADMPVVMLQMGLGMGTQPLIAYAFGARDFVKMRKIVHYAMKLNILIGVVLTGIYLVFSSSIIGLFINDPVIIGYGTIMLNALMCSGPFIGAMFILNFTFQAIGRGLPSLILSVSRQGFIYLPIVIFGNIWFGLSGIIYAQPIADIAAFLLAVIMFKRIRQALLPHQPVTPTTSK